MQEISSGEELLKVDRRGHVRVPKERREALLDEFERCGVSAAQFAAHIGVRYHTFAHWRQKRGQARCSGGKVVSSVTAASLQGGARWVEAIVEARSGGDSPAAGSALSIALPGGARLEIAMASQVALAAELLRALESKPLEGC